MKEVHFNGSLMVWSTVYNTEC